MPMSVRSADSVLFASTDVRPALPILLQIEYRPDADFIFTFSAMRAQLVLYTFIYIDDMA